METNSDDGSHNGFDQSVMNADPVGLARPCLQRQPFSIIFPSSFTGSDDFRQRIPPRLINAARLDSVKGNRLACCAVYLAHGLALERAAIFVCERVFHRHDDYATLRVAEAGSNHRETLWISEGRLHDIFEALY